MSRLLFSAESLILFESTHPSSSSPAHENFIAACVLGGVLTKRADMRLLAIFVVLLLACAAPVARADDIAVINELRDLWPGAGWPNTSYECTVDGWQGVVCNSGTGRVMYAIMTL